MNPVPILSTSNITIIGKGIVNIIDPDYQGYNRGKIPPLYEREKFIDLLFSFKNLVVAHVLNRNVFTLDSIPSDYLHWQTFKDKYPPRNEDFVLLYYIVDKSAEWLIKHEPVIYNNTKDFKTAPESKWYD